MSKLLISVLISLILFPDLYAQVIQNPTVKKIDELFEKWDNDHSPGCVVTIVRNDSILFSKGYGMANLEHSIPNTPETIFYAASVSKQFTGYCIGLLVRQEKINVDEDIHVYLPWIPDFKKKITVKNLLNHTSGIRDDLDLAAISGLGIDGILTQKSALDIIKKQSTLSFNPGERYSYSNSNYILLAEIVKTISGQSFRNFTDSVIFKPLGMVNSHFHDDPGELIKDRAFSYWPVGDTSFVNAFQNVYTFGDGGLFISANDLSKWIMNFYKPIAGDIKDIQQLTEIGRLNNGKELDYAFGIRVKNYKGRKIYTHAGALAGYRSIISVFPELKTGFIILGNVGDGGMQNKINDLADLFFDGKSEDVISKNKVSPDTSTAILKDITDIEKFTGHYIGDNGRLVRFDLKDNKMYVHGWNKVFLLNRLQKDTFCFFSDSDVKFVFHTGRGVNDTRMDFILPNEVGYFTKYDPAKPHDDEKLKQFIGRYYCSELDCYYRITMKDHTLFLANSNYSETKLNLIGENDLVRNSWFMNHLKIIRDRKNKVSGFEVSSSNLRFNKIE